jgi:hypothetical protein
MSNKHAIIWILVVGVILWVGSCKPKESDVVTPEEEDSTTIIARSCILLEENINNALYRAYEYDSTRRLMRVYEYSADINQNRLAKRYTFEYDKKDSTKIVRFRETNLVVRDQNYYYEIDYDDKNVMTTIRPFRILNSGPREIDTIKIFYDDNKRISELRSATLFNYSWDYDSAGNVKRWAIRRPEMMTDSLLAEYDEYDDKINLYQFSKGVQLMNLLRGSVPTRRNPTKYRIMGQSVESAYTYNAKGLPTQAAVKFTTIGDTISRETIYSYQLNCK